MDTMCGRRQCREGGVSKVDMVGTRDEEETVRETLK
jgi:hypothetical protein